MEKRIFKDLDGKEIVVKHRKSAVFFELFKDSNEFKFVYNFEKSIFKELFDYLRTISNDAWINVTPKEAHSLASDYDEFYDKDTDNNGYLSIRGKENGLWIERPSLESKLLFKFSKAKMESFLYDLILEQEKVK